MKLLFFILIPMFLFGQYANNLVGNPSAESGVTGWAALAQEGGDQFDISDTQTFVGDSSFYCNVDATGEGFEQPLGTNFSVLAANTYRIKVARYIVSGNVRFSDNYIDLVPSNDNSTTGSWQEYDEENSPSVDRALTRMQMKTTGGAGGEWYTDDFQVRQRIDTLYIFKTGSDTDADTVLTLSEAFETRGSHSGGYFITGAGTYDESVTLDSSFTKWEATGATTVTQVDFNSVTCTVDERYLTITTKLNDSNVTYTDSTPSKDEIGFAKWKTFPKFGGFK